MCVNSTLNSTVNGNMVFNVLVDYLGAEILEISCYNHQLIYYFFLLLDFNETPKIPGSVSQYVQLKIPNL